MRGAQTVIEDLAVFAFWFVLGIIAVYCLARGQRRAQ